MEPDDHLSHDESFLQKLTKIVLDNLQNEQFGVNELANIVGISRSRLHRKLTSIKKQSVSQFIREIRLQEAYRMLKKEEITASEVAYKVGFNNPSYFNKCFHDNFGFTPGEVKKHLTNTSNKKPGNKVNKARKTGFKSYYKLASGGVLIVLLLIIGFSLSKRTRVAKEPSIAILPFDNLSSSTENQYFADGLVEDLLNRLCIVEDLKVISRTSSEMFRDKGGTSIPEIAIILGVNYILEGSVQREGDNIKINIQLINALEDDHIFSKQYEKKLDDIFKIQGEIAADVTKELSLYVSSQDLQKIQKNQTLFPKALEYYQLGRFHSNKRKGENLKKSIEYYELAIAEDSNFALAYAGLSDTYHLLVYRGQMDRKEVKSRVIDLANKALDLDPNLAEPHAVLGAVNLYFDMNWGKAEDEFFKAISLNPNYSTAHQYYSELLSINGREKEAREQINIALKVDPYSFIIRYLSALYYYNAGQFNKAWEEVKVCLELESEQILAKNLQYDLYLRFGNDSAAYEMHANALIEAGENTREELDKLYEKGGSAQVIRWFLEQDKYWNQNEYFKAIFYAMLQEKEKTLYYLEMQLDSNKLNLLDMSRWEYRFVRSEPRFIAIREKLGLPPLPY